MLAEADRAALLEELARARTGSPLAAGPGPEAHRRSPACGDEVRVRLQVGDDVIVALTWEGHGCTVSTAAASALAAAASGLDLPGFRALTDRYLATLDASASPDPALGDLDVFAGIGRYPLRATCAALPWRATLDALQTGA